MTKDQGNKFLEVIDILSHLPKKVILQCTLSPDRIDYSYFWKLVDEYPDFPIRVAFALPSHWKTKKEHYYQTLKGVFIKFTFQAHQRSHFSFEYLRPSSET